VNSSHGLKDGDFSTLYPHKLNCETFRKAHKAGTKTKYESTPQ